MAGRETLPSSRIWVLRLLMRVTPRSSITATTLRARVQEPAGVKGSLVKAIASAVQRLPRIRIWEPWKRMRLTVPPFLEVGR